MLKEVSKDLIKNYSSQILPQMELSTNKMALIKQQTFTQNLLNSASKAGHNGLAISSKCLPKLILIIF